jgi:hypothetical protein
VTSLFPENDIKLEDLFLEIKYDGPSFDYEDKYLLPL